MEINEFWLINADPIFEKDYFTDFDDPSPSFGPVCIAPVSSVETQVPSLPPTASSINNQHKDLIQLLALYPHWQPLGGAAGVGDLDSNIQNRYITIVSYLSLSFTATASI